MARTKITVQSVAMNAGAARATGTTADPTNGHYLAVADLYPETVPVQRGARLLVLEVYNTDSADHNLTIKAGANPPAQRASLGDLVVLVAHSATIPFIFGGLESARFLQADGTVNIDLAASFAGTIYAYVLNKSV